MGIVEEYSELSKWYQKEKALNRELHTENNKLQAEVERLKNRQPELPSTGVTENIISEIQRLREFVLLVKATPDYGVGRCHHAITAEKLWAALEEIKNEKIEL